MKDKNLFLDIRNLSKTFRQSRFNSNHGPGSRISAVDDVSFQIFKSESFGIVGESGSGKSTLGRCIIRLNEPDSGQILHNGLDLLQLSLKKYAPYRKQFQMIFQNPGQSLNPSQSVENCISEPLRILRRLNFTDTRATVKELIAAVGLEEEHLSRYPDELSGGQKQRVSIARALAVNPSFIVADEPTSNLDASFRKQIVDLLLSIRQKLDLTLLLISHDMSVINYATDRVAVMYKGRIVEIGSTKDIMINPVHPYTQQLIELSKNKANYKQINNIDVDLAADDLNCSFYHQCNFAGNRCLNAKPGLIEVSANHHVACHRSLELVKAPEKRDFHELNVVI